MREEAKRTLWALAKPNVGIALSEWGFVDTFVATVLTGPFMTGFFARMTNPVPRVLEVQDFADARYLQTRALQNGTGPMLWSEFVNQFDQMMTDWVANEKDKDRRDYEKSDEEIGSWIGYLMLTPDAKLSAKRSGRVNPVTGKEDMSELEAKKSLMPHIVDYLQRRQTDNRGRPGPQRVGEQTACGEPLELGRETKLLRPGDRSRSHATANNFPAV